MKILVISSNLIGDTILSTGVIEYFLKNNPNSTFTFIIGPTAGQLYEHFPNLEKIIKVKKEKYNLHWLKIFLHCFLKKWDIIIDLRSSAISYLLFHKKKYIFKKSKKNHHLDQLSSLFGFDSNELQIYNNLAELNIVTNELNSKNKYVVIFPGGNWVPKIWPSQKYNETMRLLIKHFSNIVFIIVGSSNEKDLYFSDLKKNIPEEQIINIMGKSLTLTAAYMKKSNLFIGNDSGLMHLSVASKLKTIGLFGPTNDKIYSPKGKDCFAIRTKENYEYFENNICDPEKSYMESIDPKEILSLIKINKLIK